MEKQVLHHPVGGTNEFKILGGDSCQDQLHMQTKFKEKSRGSAGRVGTCPAVLSLPYYFDFIAIWPEGAARTRRR